jgi:hypothetical protein
MVRLLAVFSAVLLSLPQGLSAKESEKGRPRQFDLDCRGQEKKVLENYLPGFHKSGMPGEEKDHHSVRKHLAIDMIGMKFQEKPPFYSGALPDKIFKYDANDGVLVLESDPHLARRWAIRLNTYKSTAVSEGDDGEIWVEHMACRLAPFSGF